MKRAARAASGSSSVAASALKTLAAAALRPARKSVTAPFKGSLSKYGVRSATERVGSGGAGGAVSSGAGVGMTCATGGGSGDGAAVLHATRVERRTHRSPSRFERAGLVD